MSEVLAACPNPFHDDPALAQREPHNLQLVVRYGNWTVGCSCGFWGPPRKVREDAVAAWNNARCWCPIETAPKDGTKIDMWWVNRHGEGARETECFFGKGSWRWHRSGIEVPSLYTPTHWMPVPAAPGHL